jgi:hypothetical protein
MMVLNRTQYPPGTAQFLRAIKPLASQVLGEIRKRHVGSHLHNGSVLDFNVREASTPERCKKTLVRLRLTSDRDRAFRTACSELAFFVGQKDGQQRARIVVDRDGEFCTRVSNPMSADPKHRLSWVICVFK